MKKAEKTIEQLCRRTTVVILAGGRGERLSFLTEHRAKPAVTFGGKYRVIDFVLSNCINSGLNKILVAVQYKFDSLVHHLDRAWKSIFIPEKEEYLRVLPPQMRVSNGWYQGTADAVYQNIYSLRVDKPKYVLVLSGDQIYRMDYRQLLLFHLEQKADLTMAVIEVDREKAKRFGVVEIDEEGKIISIEEKPEEPRPMPGRPDKALGSMGIYVFSSRELIKELERDMEDEESDHDFAKNIIPRMLKEGRKISIFQFRDPETDAPGYWQDVGTVEDYFRTNMNLVDINPQFDLYDREWPWRAFQRSLPPAKVVFHEHLDESIFCEGCIIDEGEIIHSILSPGVKIGRGTQVIDSIIMDNVVIEDGARIVRTIIDKDNTIPAGSVIEAGNIKYEGKYEIIPFQPSGIVLLPRHFEKWIGEDGEVLSKD